MNAVNQNEIYQESLLNILNKENNPLDEEIKEQLKLNIYLSLLSLNNHNYQEKFFEQEHNTIDDFLRKINNLKVKIQLKRKDSEIDNLITKIKELHHENEKLIQKYNLDNLDIETILNSKDPKKITELIDKLTKVKIHKNDMKEEYDNYRLFISENIFNSHYYLDNDNLHISSKEREEIIPLNTFYEIFDYLLDINNYNQVFLNDKINDQHTIVIDKLINLAKSDDISKDITTKEIIPIILTNLLTKDISNLNDIDTSSFKIDNIKITDLYSFASNNKELENNKLARWNKVIIPNEYLYSKIKDLIQKGMYYYNENNFTLENIDNRTSDFKISIDIDKIPTFLNDLITNSI